MPRRYDLFRTHFIGDGMIAFRLNFLVLFSVLTLALASCGSEEIQNNSDGDPSQQNASNGGESEPQQGPDSDADSDAESDTNTDTDTDTDTDTRVDPEPETDPESPWIDEEDLGAMKVGQQWKLILDSNATTGYEWVIQPGMDAAVLEIVSSEYVSPEDTGAVGVGGTQEFVFRAIGTGTTSVLLHYIRSWEPDSPANAFTFDVTVVD